MNLLSQSLIAVLRFGIVVSSLFAIAEIPLVAATNPAVRMSIAISNSTLHEPLIGHLSISNITTGSITIDLGHNRKSNIEILLKDAQGNIRGPVRLSSEGFGRVGTIDLKP